MTIEQAIKTAEGRGYRWGLGYEDWAFATVEPEFWRALGDALGWNHCRACDGTGYTGTSHDPYPCPNCRCSGVRKSWLAEWHRFIDHLATGGSAVTFFESL